jgi:hypothetical protein
MLGMLGKVLGKNVRLLGKWLGKYVRQIKGAFRRCTKLKNPGKPGKNPLKPGIVKLTLFGVQLPHN